MRTRTTATILMICSLLWNTSLMAQQHVVDPATMRQAIAEQSAADQQNREAVLGLFERTQVRELASQLGLDVTRAEMAVASLDGADLARVADQARTADAQLAGGADTVVISVTTLLLIIILVILLAH
jgi:hypothetical protein